MARSPQQLRRDALRIWEAGVDAVRSERLIAEAVRVQGSDLVVGGDCIDLDSIRRIVVVGGGKAGAGMASALETALGPRILREKDVTGWMNVPEGCVRPLSHIRLHAARPAGVNEPTPAGAAGAEEILRRVASLGARDLVLCLISGGGSALLPAPEEGITLEDKLAVTRHLSGAGANIEQLNTVRKQLSRIKGGGLMRACRAGRLVTLIISDVLGDPLDSIASGPTVENSSTPQDALAVLQRFKARDAGVSPHVFEYLERKDSNPPRPPTCRVTNVIIGNNATAVRASARAARELGYTPIMASADRSEGPAEQIGIGLADQAATARSHAGPDCIISGGEPVVALVEASQRGKGGRNQQLILASLRRLEEIHASGIAMLSGGTDGEDGPTDAAGAVLDDAIRAGARAQRLDPGDFLARNDAYHFFQPLDALIKTGPTHTNVCDLRIVVVDRIASANERP